MNSEYGKKSPQELKEQARKQMQIASKAEPCVAVTEQNWKALISTQTAQIDMLKSILDGVSELTTKEEIRIYLNRQMNSLQKSIDNSNAMTQTFKAEFQDMTNNYVSQINDAAKNASQQVGSTSEKYSYSISQAEENGNDIAYLVANLTNILDSNHPVEDCTTMKKPRKERKNIQENPQGGFGMKM